MARIEVVGGDFRENPKSRFEGATMVLCTRRDGKLVRRTPVDITRFRVREGAWARCFDEAGDWTRALASAAVVGLPGAAINFAVPTFFLGQRALVTWANALIGAAAATAALKSDRMVRFDAHFGGDLLQARVEERALMLRLRHIYRVLAFSRR